MKFYRTIVALPSVAALALGLFPRISLAQILPDSSLPVNSIVAPNGNVFTIDGGTAAGSNLFHSFQDFSLPTGSEAFFNNALSIENIITRVTGENLSNIDGLIRANGTANLFLLNPNGIVFGPNARLDIGGSFLGSTADSVLFQDGGVFSATEANAPPLLTINVPIGLQMGQNPGAIRIDGTGNTARSNPGVAVTPGHTLAWVGSGIHLRGGSLTADSGRIEIGSVAGGEISLTPIAVGWQLGYEKSSSLAAIEFQDRSSLWNPNSQSNPQGGIHVRGSQIVVNQSQIVSQTISNAIGAPLSVTATESLTLGGTTEGTVPFSPGIVNQVPSESGGDGGNITISAPQLTLRDGARIQTLTQGAGRAGDIAIQADTILIEGFATPPENPELAGQTFNSRITSENLASGAGGTVNILTQNLTLDRGGQVGTFAGKLATGNGGSVSVRATESISAKGINPTAPNTLSGIVSTTLGAGIGGDINVDTRQLNLAGGAVVQSLSQGTGRGGDLAVNATESILGTGIHPTQRFLSTGIISFASGSGEGGNIDVSTGQLTMLDGADVSSFVRVLGDYFPGAATGKGGEVTVHANQIDLIGVFPTAPTNVSSVGSRTFGAGSGGNVYVSTERLTVADGAFLASTVTTSTSAAGQPLPQAGTGEGGNVVVDASESIEVRGYNPFLQSNSSLLGSLSFGSGEAGDAIVTTLELIVRDAGEVSTATSATGDSGQLTVNAGSILVSGMGAIPDSPAQISAGALIESPSVQRAFFLPPFPTGNTAVVTINADRLTVTDGGIVSVRHQGDGNSGQLQVNAEAVRLDRSGQITASTRSGDGGNISLNVADLQLQGGSKISAEAGGKGNGGNVGINSNTIALLEESSITANAFEGAGGNIQISTQGLFASPDSSITASSQFGVDGVVTITNPEVDPSSGLINFSQEVVDPAEQVVTGCQWTGDSEFTATGRSGIPSNPNRPLSSRRTWSDIRELSPFRGETVSTVPEVSEPSQPLVEANTWVRREDGTIELVAGSTAPGSSWGSPTHCNPVENHT
jgi:filamentous hemagglutinin family protein